MFGKKFGISEKVWKKFKNLEFPNFLKIMKKGCSTQNLKIAKNSFQLENRLKSLVKSSECRALVAIAFKH